MKRYDLRSLDPYLAALRYCQRHVERKVMRPLVYLAAGIYAISVAYLLVFNTAPQDSFKPSYIIQVSYSK